MIDMFTQHASNIQLCQGVFGRPKFNESVGGTKLKLSISKESINFSMFRLKKFLSKAGPSLRRWHQPAIPLMAIVSQL